MSHLAISLLGTFHITRGSTAITAFESNKVRALLAYLAVESDRLHTREALAALLWPESAQEPALSSLRNALANLRRVIGDREANPPYLLINHETLQFNPQSDSRLDVADVIQETRRQKQPGGSGQQTQVQARISAADSYRGPFLEGFSIPESAVFEEWVSLWRERLQLCMLENLRWLADYYETCGDYSPALEYARRQVTLESWMEEGHCQVMRLMALNGQREQALRHYHALRETLNKDLETEPSSSTTQLYQVILSGEFSAAHKTHPPHNLPVQVTSFIGRVKEIETLKEVILSGQTRLVTVTGAGGVGKTRLALQVAGELLGAFNQGVWLVELAEVTDPDRVLPAVASVLMQREILNKPLPEALIDFLKSKRILILLDNCEHLVVAVACIADRILHSCPSISIVITSREILGVNGEMPFRCPSLGLPDPHWMQTQPAIERQNAMISCEAVRLFIERSALAAPAFELNEQNTPTVFQICRRLDGIPLAIELAAARMRMLSVEQIAKRLDHAFLVLTAGNRTALPRQQTLKATIDWSYDLLSSDERTLLHRLSIFSGGWTLEAAEAVCSEENKDSCHLQPEKIIDLLCWLADKSLILVESGKHAEPRYRMLEPIRQYAREKLAADEEEPAVLQRHAIYFVLLAQQAEPNLRGAGQISWMDRLEQEIENLRLALSETLISNIPAELQLASSLMWFWHNRGRWEEGLTWLNKGLQRLNSIDQTLNGQDTNTNCAIRAKAFAAAGYLTGKLPGNQDDATGFEKASDLLKESLSIYKKLRPQDHKGMAFVLLQLVRYSNNSIQLSQFLSWLNQGLALYREVGDDFGFSEGLSQLACMRQNCGRARKILLEALQIKIKIGDIDGIAHFLGYLGDLDIYNSEYELATKHFTESIENFRKIDNRTYITHCLGKLAWLNWIKGETPQAIDIVQQALALSTEHEPQQYASFLLLLAKIHLSSGQLLDANHDLSLVLQIGKGHHSQTLQASELILHARLVWLGGDSTNAINLLEKALSLSLEIRGPHLSAEVLYYLGRISSVSGCLSKAKLFFTESVKKYAGLKLWIEKYSIAYPLEGLAGIAVLEGDPGRAAQLFGAANRRLSQIANTLAPFETKIRESEIEQIRHDLGDEEFRHFWQVGRDLSFEQAVAFALG